MKKTFFTCLFLVCIGIQNALGQVCPPEIQWQKSLGGGGYDFLATVQQTQDGGYVMGGSLDSQELLDGFRLDYWIVRLDATGETLWSKSFGGSGSDALAAVAQTDDGGFLIAGGLQVTDPNPGPGDFWIVRLDS